MEKYGETAWYEEKNGIGIAADHHRERELCMLWIKSIGDLTFAPAMISQATKSKSERVSFGFGFRIV